MKKILFFAALLAWNSSAFAQAGSLTIINNLTCDVTVGMYAIEGTYIDGAGCSLVSYFFVVPAGTALSWSDPTNFTLPPGGPSPAIGWSSQLNPIPVSYWGPPLAVADFTWTDAQFQFGCPECGSNGAVSDPSSLISSCFLDPPTWSGPCSYNAKFVSSTPGYPMGNVTLTFF